MVSASSTFLFRSSVLGALCVSFLLLAASALPASAQDSEPSRREKLMHYSLYYESFKNDNFKGARSDLLWVLKHAPGTPDGDDDNYERVVKLYEGLAKQASDEQAREALLDTAATYLASAPKKMQKQDIKFSRYEWEVKKGRFVEKHKGSLPDVKGLKSPAFHYRKAFKLAPKKLDPYYIQQVLTSYLQNNKLQKALDFANTLEAKRGDDKEVAKMISSTREKIFGKNPQAQISYLEKQVKQNPDSTKLLTKLFNAYNQQGNVSKASKIAKRLMKKEPSAETVREIAQMRLENGRPKAALKAYNRAAKQGAKLKAADYFNRGNAFQKMGQLAKAREEYQKAIDMKKNFGRAYIAIGDLYTKAVNQCSGDKLGRKDRAVYWAAVDQYQKAKEIKPSLASVADSKIQAYRKVFPRKQAIFFNDNWEIGKTATIDYGCYSWIGETTTVRPAPSSD
ncbi:MAG: tetratricopeptide repeat protein [Salinibacter sp.]